MFKKPRVYLDFAAASPLSLEAKKAMRPYLGSFFANPSAIHNEGQKARAAVNAARDAVARALHVRPEFITFTSGGTESNNLAIIGYVEFLHRQGRAYDSMEVLTTKIEHPSVTNAVSELERRGVKVVHIPVTETGAVSISELSKLISPVTVLCTIAYINSEIGTIQPLHALKKSLREGEKKFNTTIALHLDAAQAPFWVSCQFDSLGADLVSLDVGKCGGPKGIGILVRSRRVDVVPILFGGNQEDGLRPGTENVMGIVGGAAAVAAAQSAHKLLSKKVSDVRDAGIKILTAIEGVTLNGAVGDERVANNINISINGIDTEFLAVVLDKHGFAVSTKSACSGAGGGASTVVLETTKDATRAKSTLRLTLGPGNRVKELKAVARIIGAHQKMMSQLTQK